MKPSLSLRHRFSLHRLTRSLKNPRYLLKWLLMGMLIGIIAGLGAIVFYAAIHFASQVFMTGLVGYTPPDPAGEGKTSVMPFWNSARPWLLPVVTALGGLISGIIVFTLAPEAEGHGTDAAIAAFHEGKTIRARIPLVKLVASAITIGTGGSAGREGPAAQISAGFGSLLATALRLDIQDRRIALATGMGAGIGAIFGAPLGGAILAAEILYKDDLEVETIIPALIASIVGYSIFGAWSGWHSIFSTPANLTFNSPLQLPYYVVLGLLCGIMGKLYSNGFYGVTDIFHKIKLPKWLKPAIGGLMVGLICLVIPQALGMGYGWISGSYGSTRPTRNSHLDYHPTTIHKNPDDRPDRRLWRLWRYLWARHGYWRHGRRIALETLLSCATRHTCTARTICHNRYDGTLWWRRTCSTGCNADGCRDDRQSLSARSSHDRCQHFIHARRVKQYNL